MYWTVGQDLLVRMESFGSETKEAHVKALKDEEKIRRPGKTGNLQSNHWT